MNRTLEPSEQPQCSYLDEHEATVEQAVSDAGDYVWKPDDEERRELVPLGLLPGRDDLPLRMKGEPEVQPVAFNNYRIVRYPFPSIWLYLELKQGKYQGQIIQCRCAATLREKGIKTPSASSKLGGLLIATLGSRHAAIPGLLYVDDLMARTYLVTDSSSGPKKLASQQYTGVSQLWSQSLEDQA